MALAPMIPRAELMVRGLYRVEGRNFTLGAWDGESFIGARLKFYDYRLDGELYWEDSETHGTCKPIEFLGYLPEAIALHLGNRDLLTFLIDLEKLPPPPDPNET